MSQSTSPRKVLLGIATPSQMFRVFNRHHQAPFDAHRMSGRLYAGEWFRIDRAAHFYMLNLMPPLFQRGDVFAMREFLAESVTSVFVTLTIQGETRFYHAYCDLADKTSIDTMRDAIIAHETGTDRLSREVALEHVWSTAPDDYRSHDDEDSRKRSILVHQAEHGTVLMPLELLTTAELPSRVVGFGDRAAA